MKTLKSFLTILALLAMAGGLNSCEKHRQGTEPEGSLELHVNVGELEEAGLKSDEPDSLDIARFYALITVVNADSVPVIEDELFPLYKFGDGYFTERIKLKEGPYLLVKLMIVSHDGEVIYAAPLEGSPKAYLVKHPLPIAFGIGEGETTRLSPEVLPVQGEPPSEFGYASFGFSLVKPLPFYIIVMIDDPQYMIPVYYTEAALSVYHPDGWHYDFYLKDEVNRVVIRGGAEYYKFIVEVKGYEPQEFKISARELLNTTPQEPLVVRVKPIFHVLKLQPGPDDGIDAMITTRDPDQNFGKHPYFEATFISDSILTVMHESRSMIRFIRPSLPKSATITKVTLTLFYDVPLPWDSLWLHDTVVWFGDIAYGGVLQQIVDPWEEHEVTWNKQPNTTLSNQVFIEPFIRNCNFITVDITRLFLHYEISAPYYGMMLKLVPEPRFRGFRFASSDYREPGMRPMLNIFYMLPTG